MKQAHLQPRTLASTVDYKNCDRIETVAILKWSTLSRAR